MDRSAKPPTLPRSGRQIATRIEGRRHSRIEITSGPAKELFKKLGRPDGKGGYRIGSEFSEHVAAIKKAAAAILRACGLPDVVRLFVTKSAPDRWQPQQPAEDDFKSASTVDYYVRKRGFMRDSRQDLAARILVTAARMESNPEQAKSLVFELGQFWMLLRVYAAESAPGMRGGSRAALTKRRRAAAWQTKSVDAVKQYIAAGRTDSNIGALLANRAGKAPRTVAAFAAKVRKDLGKRKKSAE